MGIVSIPKRKVGSGEEPNAILADPIDWVDVAAGGALVAGGLLLLMEQRRAGMVMAVAGTALTLLGQQEAVRTWWDQVPGYVDQVERMIAKVQNSMDDLTAKRETLQQILTGTGRPV
jgi:hypothetical protein